MKDISGRLFQGKTHLRSVLRHSWKKDKCLPSSEEIMPIFPTKSNQESLKATINSAETKVITTANKKEIYIYISQRANKDTFKLRKARENATDQVAISFSFKSDWFRKWREFSASIIEQVKPNQSNPRLLITFNYMLLYYSMIIQSYFIGNGVNHKWKHLRQTTQKCLQNCEAYFSL